MMNYLKTVKPVMACGIFFLCFSVFKVPELLCQEPEDAMTIAVTEIKEEGYEPPAGLSLSDVENARKLTNKRIYGLAVLWLLILLVIFLVRIQARDDEKLYWKGYYSGTNKLE